MDNDRLTQTARRLEAIRKIVTNVIWLLVVLVVLAAGGRYLVTHGSKQPVGKVRSMHKQIAPALPWQEVDQAVVRALAESRTQAEAFARKQLDAWTGQLMYRVDQDFIPWYFSYWTQQFLGLEGLWQYGVHAVVTNRPTAAEKVTGTIQQEFAKRVLRPQIAEMELERIVRETVGFYLKSLKRQLAAIPRTYTLPQAEWEHYLEGIALTTVATEGNRTTPLTLKMMTASSAGGALLLAGKIKFLVGKLTGKVMAKSAGKAASKMAAKTGSKVAAKAGGKFLGTIVGVGVLVWDVWDHRKTSRENRPILRQSLVDYFAELKDILLHDPEAGMMSTFNNLEKQMFVAVHRQNPVSP